MQVLKRENFSISAIKEDKGKESSFASPWVRSFQLTSVLELIGAAFCRASLVLPVQLVVMQDLYGVTELERKAEVSRCPLFLVPQG